MTRKELAAKIVKALSPYGYAYGGYVRDLVAGDEFNDVDFFLPKSDSNYDRRFGFRANERAIALFEEMGLKAVRTVDSKHVNAYHPSWTGSSTKLFKSSLMITDPSSNASVNLELVWSDTTNPTNDTPYPSLDADVNALTIDREGEFVAIAGQDTETVIAHIKERKFIVPDGSVMMGMRLNKLLKKGYTMTLPGGLPVKPSNDDFEEVLLESPIETTLGECQPGDIVEWGRENKFVVIKPKSQMSGWIGYTLTVRMNNGIGWSPMSSTDWASDADREQISRLGLPVADSKCYYEANSRKVRIVARRVHKSSLSKLEPKEVKVEETKTEEATQTVSEKPRLINPFWMVVGAAMGGLLTAAATQPEPVRVEEETELTDDDIIDIEEIANAR